MDRLIGSETNLSIRARFSALRAFVLMRGKLTNLAKATNEGTANPAQEKVAQALGAVVSGQVEREGHVCNLVFSLAMTSTREDIIPPELKAQILDTKLP
jgi:hypothetical protein